MQSQLVAEYSRPDCMPRAPPTMCYRPDCSVTHWGRCCRLGLERMDHRSESLGFAQLI